MRSTYTDGFKEQAIQKALQRAPRRSLRSVAEELGCGYSTLHRWIGQHSVSFAFINDKVARKTRPLTMPEHPPSHPLNAAQKLDLVIACDGLDDEALGAHCRRHGVYPHQVVQWKSEFAGGAIQTRGEERSAETKPLKQEVKALKKELRRKEKALAEAAALLVLQKKVQRLWSDDEGDLL